MSCQPRAKGQRYRFSCAVSTLSIYLRFGFLDEFQIQMIQFAEIQHFEYIVRKLRCSLCQHNQLLLLTVKYQFNFEQTNGFQALSQLNTKV